MNLILDINDFSFKNIIFNESIKNTIMENSNFIRINYSNKHFILNGIYIKINFIEEVDNSNNIAILQFVEKLEKFILNFSNNKKNQIYKIKEQVTYLLNKILANVQSKHNNHHHNNHNIATNYILKISGMWETNIQIGITYKIFPINHL